MSTMQTQSARYRIGSSGYGECSVPPSGGGTATSLPNIGNTPASSQQSTYVWDDSNRRTPSHFQRSYTALDRKAQEYGQIYQQLTNNISHRHPYPGRPRERQGSEGGAWRHIREVLGYSGSQQVYVDGLVRLYDYDESQCSRLAQPYRRCTFSPLAGADSARTAPESRSGVRNTSAESTENGMPVVPETARPPSNRYKGFYAYTG